MGQFNKTLQAVNNIIEDCRERGIIHLHTNTQPLKNNRIQVGKKELINFGSCSYLGLEFDERIIAAGVDALQKYGSQFSSSRAYMSLGLYEEFEGLMNQIFGGSCIVSPTTTLGHIASIPVIVEDEDAVIMDHLVHNSVQTAVALLKPRRIPVELVRHNKMEALEEKIIRLRERHKRIWYMADGIYSMWGDACPLAEIDALMTKYPELHLYIDDAHGVGCMGKAGRGYVLEHLQQNERIVVAASLAKAFAGGGGVIVFPNENMAQKVRNCGGPMIFSGPLQPANLGVGIASAKIMLSDDLTTYQKELQENIAYAQQMIQELDLPCIAETASPIFFIGVSLPKIGFEVIENLKAKGFYTNIGVFPAAPMKNTGVRITITRLHTKAQIRALFIELRNALDEALVRHDFSYEKIYKAFKIKPQVHSSIKPVQKTNSSLRLESYRSIYDIDKKCWNGLFDSKGMLNYEGIALLENSFTGNAKAEHNWEFEYLIIRDEHKRPILATFLTVSLNKDDMMSSREVSTQVENSRQNDPYYLTSKVLAVGAPLLDGEQLYLDKQHPAWKTALNMLLESVNKRQMEKGINQVIIRDFEQVESDFERIFINNGFFKYQMMDNNVIDNFDWKDLSEFRAGLSRRSKAKFNIHLKNHLHKFELRENKTATEAEIQHWYQLYLNVKARNLSVNTFTLPYKLFKQMAQDKNCTAFELYPTKDYELEGYDGKAVAWALIQRNGEVANFLLIGLNYNYQSEYRVYVQMSFRGVLWAKENNIKQLNLGYTAEREKRKVGARQVSSFAFMQVQDNFNAQVLSEM